MKLNIEIDRIKNCGVDPSYDLIVSNDKNEDESFKALCFDKDEVMEKVKAFIEKSFIKD